MDRHRRAAFGSLATAAALVLLAGCGTPSHDAKDAARASAGSQGTPVQVSVGACGQGWTPTAGSAQTLTLHNGDDSAGEVEIVDHAGREYDGVEDLAPGTEVTLHLTLATGQYAVRCLLEDQPTVTGPFVSVQGASAGQPSIKPVDQSDLIPAAKSYQSWVRGQLPGLIDEVAVLKHAVAAGNRRSARSAWLTAHLHYERLGAAYGAFGHLDDDINGFGDHQPHGFHLVERDLWGSATTATTVRDTGTLAKAVHALRAQLDDTDLDPLDLSLRAHEITENALEFQLDGSDDFGSHSDLASVAAELTGTRQVLQELRDVLVGRIDPDGLIAAVDHARAVVVDGPTEVAITRLPRLRRERIDAAISGLAERLAPVAATLEPRRS